MQQPTCEYSWLLLVCAFSLIILACSVNTIAAAATAEEQHSAAYVGNALEIDAQRNEYFALEQSLWQFLDMAGVTKEVQLKKIYETHRQFINDHIQRNFEAEQYDILNHHEWSLMERDFLQIDGIFGLFKNFLNKLDNGTNLDERAVLYICDIVLRNDKTFSMTRIFQNIDVVMVKQTMFYPAIMESRQICQTQQSAQQFLYSLYADIALTELKGYTMMEFSWMILRVYGKGDFTHESHLMRMDFQARNERAISLLLEVMRGADRVVWRCDPSEYIKGETYDEITKLLQGFVENEVNFNNAESCLSDCAHYQSTKTYGCYQDEFCRVQPKCKGGVYNCEYVDSDMWVCLALLILHGVMSMWSMKMEEFTARKCIAQEAQARGIHDSVQLRTCELYKNKIYVRQKSTQLHIYYSLKLEDFGSREVVFIEKFDNISITSLPDVSLSKQLTQLNVPNAYNNEQLFVTVLGLLAEEKINTCQYYLVESWWWYLFWHCSYCFCLCDEQLSSESDRYFSLRESLAHVENNKVVTGLRFRKFNQVFHIQIQEGELLPRGAINTSTLAWRPVHELSISNVRIGHDYHMLTFYNRTIDLDEIVTDDNNYVVTGVRFRMIGTHLNLEVKLSEFNFETGKLISPEVNSFWKSNDNTEASGDQRRQVQPSDPDIPILTQVKSYPDSKHNQFISFSNTAMTKDAAQTTIPFIDIQDVVTNPPVPLAGVGIYHKGSDGFGGFLGPKIVTYDFTLNV